MNRTSPYPLICKSSVVLFLALVSGLALPISSTHAEVSCLLAKNAYAIAIRLRGLPKKHDVRCELRDRAQVERYLRNELEKKIPKKRIKAEAILFRLLGIIPADFDYVTGLIRLYTDQLGGYYDPEEKYYAMAAWMPEMMQMTIAVHELTHALQDQYFDLKTLIDVDEATNDEQLARAALVEGDATAVMIDYSRDLFGQRSIAHEASVGPLMAQNIVGSLFTPGLQTAPSSIRSLMLFPYVGGLNFAHALLRQGGYRKIDQAFRNLPRSTEEILHPEKYGTEKPDFEQIELPSFPDGKTPGEKVADETLGEFTISALLNSYLPPIIASRAAAGWGGDRAWIYRTTEGVELLTWRTRWDSVEDRDEFFEALRQAFENRLSVTFTGAGYLEKGTYSAQITKEQNDVVVEVKESAAAQEALTKSEVP